MQAVATNTSTFNGVDTALTLWALTRLRASLQVRIVCVGGRSVWVCG